MKRRDFLMNTASSALGISAVSQLLTSDAFGSEAASMSSAPTHAPGPFIGLQLFKNKNFDAKKWSLDKYLDDASSVEPPYHVGMACTVCHTAFNPNRPPKNPAEPKWENLDSHIGSQYFREGMLFGGLRRLGALWVVHRSDRDFPQDQLAGGRFHGKPMLPDSIGQVRSSFVVQRTKLFSSKLCVIKNGRPCGC